MIGPWLITTDTWPVEYPKRVIDEARKDDQAGIGLAQCVDLPVDRISLVWDLGNLTHNGQGVAIVTRRIVSDNPHLGENGVGEVLEEKAGIDRLLLIDVEPGDVTGHADGMVRFLSDRTVAVGAYPQDCELESFMDGVAAGIQSELGPELRIVRLVNAPPENRQREGVPSAVGNYLNCFRAGGTIYIPSCGLPQDEMALRELRAAVPGCRVVPVPAIEPARLGGVLTCVTCVLPALSA